MMWSDKIFQSFRIEILFIVIFFIIKIPIILSSPDLLYSEECVFGTLAQEMISGLKSPIFDYFIGNHHGYPFILSTMVIPLSIFLGEIGLSIKIYYLVFDLILIVSIYSLLKRFFSRTAALIGLLVSILSFPTLIIGSLQNTGHFLITNSFTILLFGIYLFSREKNNPKRYYIFSGLIFGLGIWINYSFYVSLIFISLLLVFEKRKFSAKNSLIFLISFLVACSPWIYYQSISNFGEQIFPYSKTLIDAINSPQEFLGKLSNYLSTSMLNSFGFSDFGFLSGIVMNLIYQSILLISYLILILTALNIFISKKQLKIDRKILVIILFPVFFLLVYSALSYDIDPSIPSGYRYLFPVFSFRFIIISIAITKLIHNRKKMKVFGFLILISLILIGTIGNLSVINFDNLNPQRWINYKDSCYDLFCFYTQGETCLYELNVTCMENPRYNYERCVGLIRREIKQIVIDSGWDDTIYYCGNLSGKMESYCYEEIGFLRTFSHNDLNSTLDLCRSVDNSSEDYCYFGAFMDIDCDSLMDDQKLICDRRYGFDLGWLYGENPEIAIKKLVEISNNTKEYSEGFELYITRNYNQTFDEYCLLVSDEQIEDMCMNLEVCTWIC